MRGALAALALLVAAPAPAQDAGTLADIRQNLAQVYVELQRLKRELSTTGTPGAQIGGATTLERIDSIEAALSAQTAQVEALDARIQRIVADGTNRIGDLEFRVCEIEPGCDFGEIGSTLPIGGEGDASPTIAIPDTPQTGEPELAVGERDDFDRARAAYDRGEWEEAARLLGAYSQAYPGGPLSGEANFLRGDALRQLGQDPDAARAYLESFSGDPSGPWAPQALLQLGLALERLGQPNEACVTLGEVTARFPSESAAAEAQGAARNLGCG
jgi:tol-pal system protein YbgF